MDALSALHRVIERENRVYTSWCDKLDALPLCPGDFVSLNEFADNVRNGVDHKMHFKVLDFPFWWTKSTRKKYLLVSTDGLSNYRINLSPAKVFGYPFGGENGVARVERNLLEGIAKWKEGAVLDIRNRSD